MSVFIPDHDPPTWWDRVRGHPEVWVALWSCVVGLQVAVDPWIAGFQPSPSLGELPRVTAALLAAALTGGGAAALVGVLNRWDNRTRAWAVERAGWLVTAVGWISYAIVVLNVFTGSTISWGSALVLAGLALTRLVALKTMERQARAKRAAVRAQLADRSKGERP